MANRPTIINRIKCLFGFHKLKKIPFKTSRKFVGGLYCVNEGCNYRFEGSRIPPPPRSYILKEQAAREENEKMFGIL